MSEPKFKVRDCVRIVNLPGRWTVTACDGRGNVTCVNKNGASKTFPEEVLELIPKLKGGVFSL